MANYRRGRINEEMQKELSVLMREIKDPRVSDAMVSITAAEVTPDLKFATVYFSVLIGDAANAKKAGLDGVVCSPLEAGKVHDRCGEGFLTVTPGVRFADGDIGDQKRVMTPAEAKKIGSDYIVVGRPITAAEDPVAAYERCVREFCD